MAHWEYWAVALAVCNSVLSFDNDVNLTIEQQGRQRWFMLHAPPAREPGPRPLIVNLHGYTDTAVGQIELSGDQTILCGAAAPCDFLGITDQHPQDWLVAYPQGIGLSWNGGAGCCAPANSPTQPIDDVGFMLALVRRVREQHALSAVFATGFSNGGVMSWRLGCQAPQIFRAIAPVHGALGGAWGVDPANPGFNCSFSPRAPPPPALVFTGGADYIQPWTKVEASSSWWIDQSFRNSSARPAQLTSFQNRSVHCTSTADSRRNVTVCFSTVVSDCPTACSGKGPLACIGAAKQCCVTHRCTTCGSCTAYHSWPGARVSGNQFPTRASAPDIHATTEILEFFSRHL